VLFSMLLLPLMTKATRTYGGSALIFTLATLTGNLVRIRLEELVELAVL
jgi:hypothetical protein